MENDYNPKRSDMVSSCIVGMDNVWIFHANGFTTEYVNMALKRRLTGRLKDNYNMQQWSEDKLIL